MAISILSPVSEIYRRDVPVDAHELVDPTNGNCLVAGAWVNLNGSGQAADDTDVTVANMFQVFTEKGDYSAQALDRVTILNSFDYIAETDQYAGTPAAGDALSVNTDGKLATTTSAGNTVVAFALAAPTPAGMLKYQRVSPFRY